MNDDINLRTIHDTIYDIRNVLLIFPDKAFFLLFLSVPTRGNNRVRRATIYDSVQLFVFAFAYCFRNVQFIYAKIIVNVIFCQNFLSIIDNFIPKIFVLNKEYFTFSLYIYIYNSR